MEKRILSVGGGNMGRAIIGGLLDKGYDRALLEAVDPDANTRAGLEESFGIRVHESVSTLTEIDIVLLAVKPQIMRGVAEALAPLFDGGRTLAVSIAAGVTTAQLAEWLGERVPVVRVMPNTPSLVGCGAAALFATARVNAEDRNAAESILTAVGVARWVTEESSLDAVTALSGSGPAYFFLFLELLEKIGIELGLDEELARTLSIETAHGAAVLARQSAHPPATLREQVTSPGGTTEQALKVLRNGELEDLLRRALGSAARRSRELAGDSD